MATDTIKYTREEIIMKIYYKPYLKKLARKLRNNSTLSEVLLWQHLKQKKMLGYQFYRQKPIGSYIVDFFCYRLKLVIEIDGCSHTLDKLEYDMNRQKYLESINLTVLRFDDLEVKKDINNVLFSIETWILERQEK